MPVTALAAAAAVVALVVPSALVTVRARARRRATREVWPDVVDHLVSAERSGLALPDSVVTLARAGPPVTRAAFAEFESEYRATGNFGLCIGQLKDRLADPVADRILGVAMLGDLEEARLRLAETETARDFQATAQGLDALTRAYTALVMLEPDDGGLGEARGMVGSILSAIRDSEQGVPRMNESNPSAK